MKIKLLNALTAAFLFLLPILSFAQTPTLGTAANFVLFTTDGAMTCSGTRYLTHLTGDVGSNLAGSVTGFGNVDGVMHDFDVASALCVPDVVSLYTELSTAIPTGTLASPFGNGVILAPGVYSIPTAATLNLELILDAAGDPNAVFIFQIGGMFTTNASAKVKLINGARACNVFWQVGGAVNVGTGTFLRGTIVADGQIDMTSTLDTLEGRALAMNAAVLVSQLVAYTPIGCGSPYLTGPGAPALLSTATYGVFSSIGAVTSTPVTYVIGDVGGDSEAPTGFDPLNVTGTIHAMDPSTAAAAGDLTNVYNYLVAMPADIDLLDPGNFGHGLVLTPHSYQITGITQLTGNLILNAEGNPDAVFVIKINGALTTGSLSRIMLINGTQAKNVYWKVDGAVNVFSNSVFNGSLIVAGAITLNTGDTLNGRALTINGAVAINGSYVNITPPPCVAPPITGTSQVCQGATITLANVDTGGTWVSSDLMVATVDSSSGIVTGMTPGFDTITYITPLACESILVVTVNASPAPIIGLDSVCVGNTITLTDATSVGTWSSSNNLQATVGSSTGVVTGVAAGTPTISFTSGSGCAATKIVTVNALTNAGTITGSSNVCVGSSVVLADTAPGGVWSSSNSSATVVGGTVTGIVSGIDTISYTVTGICGTSIATKIITVNPVSGAGVITGASTVCVGSTITLTDTVPGGTWSSSNATATVGTTGIVSGVTAGIDTINYTVSGSCGTATATKTITVNPLPDAGTISGASSVCVGSTTLLTDGVSGGTWSSSNANATVSGGLVSGVTAGLSTISYSVTNSCGTAIATKAMTVNPTPDAGSISGLSVVCEGSSITLTDGISGGTWSSSNANATVGTTGVVSGVLAGIDTISYTVTNTCGTATTTKNITVNPLPNAGSISGLSSVCVGSTILLVGGFPGGTWSSSNSNAMVAGGTVMGITAGMSTISYSITNSCGTSTATKTISVNPLPNAGVISGLSVVCEGSSIALTDGVPGGTWSSSNATATIGTTGVVSGVLAGIDTISYTVTNTCGTATTTKTITINPLPNAGSVSGLSSVCVGSTILLVGGFPGGTWSSSNARATVSGGLVTGVLAGANTISYTVTNSCGTATATKDLSINPLPNAGFISGFTEVCIGSTILLTDLVSGGTWSSSNATATVGTTGAVTGAIAGIDTISYAVTNSCGIATATFAVTVNPLPDAGIITGASSVCIGSSITLTDIAVGGTWNSSNSNAVVFGGVVTGVTTGIDTISYTVTNSCGTDVVTKSIVINPLPDAGFISGAPGVCIGSSITLSDVVTGGVWSSSNTRATVSGGVVTGITAGIDTISYAVTNVCGTAVATKIITVNLLPVFPSITTQSPAAVCKGTMYQNFGAATMPPANTTYRWTADNATVWAQGTGHQYSLISFTQAGIANVYLNATITGTGCSNSTMITVIVDTNLAEIDNVSYFNRHFVCTPNNEGSYQWGYDDIHTLDSTILIGEINQDYINTSPDFANKAYWVMTTMGTCMQKTYYRNPTAVENVNIEAGIKVYPNPTNSYINVEISSPNQTVMQVEVVNMMGQRVSVTQATDNRATVDVSALPSGYYLINCYRDGIKIAGSRFIKN